MANTAWALSKLQVCDEPLMQAIASQSIRQIAQCGAQNLGNLAWAFAKIAMQDAPLMDAISSAAIAKITACGHQEIGNISWAFATLCIRDLPLLDAIAAEAIATISAFNIQGIANTVWAFAKLSVTNHPFLAAISSAAMRKISAWDPQAIANLAWSFATLGVTDEPLLDAISAQALPLISEFSTQHLSNTVWAYATLKVTDGELSASGVPRAAERSALPLAHAEGGGILLDESMPNYSSGEVTSALAEQGLCCTRLVIAPGDDAAAVVENAFGDPAAASLDVTPVQSVGSSGSIAGVLVFADGRYLACLRVLPAVDASVSMRDVVSGVERKVTDDEFAEHARRYECFKVHGPA